eukprot:9492062-Pyramimonas_sp.AAC.1
MARPTLDDIAQRDPSFVRTLSWRPLPPELIAPLRDRISGWWTRAHVVLDAYARHRARSNGTKQQELLLSTCKSLAEEAPEQGHQVIRPNDGILRASWLQLLSAVDSLSAQELAEAVRFSERISQRSQRRAVG